MFDRIIVLCETDYNWKVPNYWFVNEIKICEKRKRDQFLWNETVNCFVTLTSLINFYLLNYKIFY